MQAMFSSERSVFFNQTTLDCVPEDKTLRSSCCENLRSNIVNILVPWTSFMFRMLGGKGEGSMNYGRTCITWIAIVVGSWLWCPVILKTHKHWGESPRHRDVDLVINQHPFCASGIVITVLYSSHIIATSICITFCSFAARLMKFGLIILHQQSGCKMAPQFKESYICWK